MTDSKASVFIYYHTHWDREWYEPFCAFQVRLAEVVDEILERLDTGVLPCFTLDGQTSLLADYLELRPENEGRLKRYIKNGQINIGPWYVMPDEFLVSGESLIRNLKRGIEESRAWGCDEFTGYLPDTFGHSADMPLILNYFGIDSAVLWRGVNPETSEFIWKSRDGSQVLGYHLAEGYFQNMLHDPELSEEERATALINLKEKTLAKSANNSVLLPLGGDHLGPVTKLGKQLLDRTILDYQSGHPVDYLKQINKGGLALPEVTGELMDNSVAFLLPGVWSSRMYLKQANRKLEYTTIPNLEQQIAMNQLLDPRGESQRLRYPKHELNKLWTLVLQNHPHDSICGCSVDAVHRENEVRFDSANQIANALTVRLNHQLAQSATEDEWVVVNSTDVQYTGVVEAVGLTDLDPDSLGNKNNMCKWPDWLTEKFVDNYRWNTQDVPQAHRKIERETQAIYVESLAPHSVTRFSKRNVKRASSEFVKPFLEKRSGKDVLVLENQYLRIEGSEKGIQIFDKQRGKVICHGLEFLVSKELGDSYNNNNIEIQKLAVNYFPVSEYFLISSECSPDLKEAFSGFPNVFSEDSLYSFLQFSLCLKEGSPLLYGHLMGALNSPLSYKTRLQIRFITEAPLQELLCESHFGLETRSYDPDFDLASQVPVEPMKEVLPNTGPIQRFVMGHEQVWITKGLTEYEVLGSSLLLTVHRPFQTLSSDETGVRGANAGPPFKTLEGQLKGRNIDAELAWAPLPAEGGEQSAEAFAYEMAERFYKPVVAFSGELPAVEGRESSKEQSQSLVQWDNREIVSSAIKCPDDAQDKRGLIVRLFNVSNKAQETVIQTGFDYKEAVEVDFMEEPLKTNLKKNKLKKDRKRQALPVAFKAHEVKTIWFQVE